MDEPLLIYWRRNLVGSRQAFSFNSFLTIMGGTLFSFSVIESPFMLLFFGMVSPALFTLCAYASFKDFRTHQQPDFPNLLLSRLGSNVAMVFDLFIIAALAALIYFNVLNFFFFRFLQTLLLPILSLSMLRFLHLASQSRGQQ